MSEIQLMEDGGDWHRLYGAMLFPLEKPNVRDRLTLKMSYLEHQVFNRFNENDAIPAYLTKLLVDTPNEEELDNVVFEQTKKGLIAGDVFLQLFLMADFKTKRPSLGKARYMVNATGKDFKFQDGTTFTRSDTTIKRYYREFSSVVHLWAAIRMNHQHPYVPEGCLFTEPKGIYAFLRVAALLQEFGVMFSPTGSKGKVILDYDNCVTIPANISAAEPIGGKPSDKWLEILKAYKAS